MEDRSVIPVRRGRGKSISLPAGSWQESSVENQHNSSNKADRERSLSGPAPPVFAEPFRDEDAGGLNGGGDLLKERAIIKSM
jgi:hypothetical protein